MCSPIDRFVLAGHYDALETARRHEKIKENVNSQTSWGTTGLCWAAEHDEVRIIKDLLDSPVCDISSLDIHGRTALHVAIDNNSVNCLRILLEHPKCSSDTMRKTISGSTILHRAVCRNRIECLRLILENPALTSDTFLHKNNEGNTILHLAIIMNSVESVNLILSHPMCTLEGSIYKIKNNDNKTVKMIAKEKSKFEIVATLRAAMVRQCLELLKCGECGRQKKRANCFNGVSNRFHQLLNGKSRPIMLECHCL